ncbi:MAG: VOC family protein [Marinoscillum sp.]
MINPQNIFSSFSVIDLDSSEKFYNKVLGLKTKKDKMGVHVFIADEHEVFLYPKNEQHIPATFTVLNLVVPNIEEAAEHLAKHGISLEKYDGLWQDEDGIMRAESAEDGPSICWFKDPSGNVLSFIEANNQ